MDDLDHLMLLTTVMERNNGVLRPRDHRASRATFDQLVRSGALVRVPPGTLVDAALITSRRTRCAAALATYPGSMLWGPDAAAAVSGTLTKAPFGANDRVQLAHTQSRYPNSGVSWVRRKVPSVHRVRVDGLRCPSARYLAVEAAARDSGGLIETLLRCGRIVPSELLDVLPAFAGSAGQAERCRVVRGSVDNPWSGANASC